MSKSRRRPLLILIAILVAVAAATVLYVRQPAREVLAEPAASKGPYAFTPPLTTATPTASPGPTGTDLYAGSGDNRLCDRRFLIDYLNTHQGEAKAWAEVEHISTDQIPAFVNGLTPKVLSHDVRVTNHGYIDGKAVPRQSVLQAGTVVLVDSKDQPVTRCLCGNPLLPAIEALGPPDYKGDKWPGFDPGHIIVIQPSPSPSPSGSISPSGSARPSPSPSVSPSPSAQASSP